MKVQKNVKQIIGYSFVLSMVLLLPGCRFIDWFKEKFGGGPSVPAAAVATIHTKKAMNDGSPVLVTMSGKPLITEKMLETEKQKLIASNPQLQAMIAFMDEKQLNRNLVDGMASREIIRRYVAESKLDESDKYKKDFEMLLGQVRDALNTRYFMDAFAVQVADNEVKKFYDENKDVMPNLLLSRGGVQAVAVSFVDQKSANEFMEKVKTAKNDINRIAKDAGLTDKVQDFKLVNEQSLGIEPELRDKIVALKSVPSLNSFKVGNQYWVVAAQKKEESKYRPLDQVKDDIKQMIEKDKMMKKFEEEVARLKGQYGIEINEDFFAAPVEAPKTVQASAASTSKAATPKVAEKTAKSPEQKPKVNVA